MFKALLTILAIALTACGGGRDNETPAQRIDRATAEACVDRGGLFGYAAQASKRDVIELLVLCNDRTQMRMVFDLDGYERG